MMTDKEGFTHVDPRKALLNWFTEEALPEWESGQHNDEDIFEHLWGRAYHAGYEAGHDEGVEAESERLGELIVNLENQRNECIRDMKSAIGILEIKG